MKKTLIIIGLLLATGLAMRAQEFYKGGEFSIEAFGSVVSPDLDSERTQYGFGGQFFLTRNLGIGAYTAIENLDGHTLENVTVRGIWRVPIERHALYFWGGATRYFHDETRWNLVLGPGYEFRPIEHVGLFAEIGMEKELTGEVRDLSATARAGLRFSF